MMAKKKDEENKDEMIGFHKGSLATLSKEREEFVKLLNIVEQLMQMHIKALKDMGVDLVEQAKEMKKSQAGSAGKQSSGKPIDELL